MAERTFGDAKGEEPVGEDSRDPQGERSPEATLERRATGRAGFQEASEHIRVVEPDEPTNRQGEAVDGTSEAVLSDDREMSDGELLEIWENTTAGVRDGRIQAFDNKADLIQHVMRRLGR